MAMSTLTASMDPTDRTVLDHYKEGVGLRTIGLRTGLELTDVQRIVQELTGNDRSKAAALVAAFDQHNGGAPAPATPAPAPAPAATPAVVKARKSKAPRTPAEDPQDAPAAPTVVPVDLTEPLPADVPVTPISLATDDQPAEPAEAAGEPTPEAEDAPPAEPETEAEPELVTRHDGDQGDGDQGNIDDDWAALDRAMSPLLERALRDPAPADAEAAALAGPTDPLPNVQSFEDLMAAVQGVRDSELSALATQIGALVDQLHARYAQARKSREVRAEAVRLRRDLTRTLAMLARLEGTAPAETDGR